MVTHEQAQAAIATLVAFGRVSFSEPDKAPEAMCIGIALARVSQHMDVLEISRSYLEDLNQHTTAALVDAVNNRRVTVDVFNPNKFTVTTEHLTSKIGNRIQRGR
jgi:hypothetical protein